MEHRAAAWAEREGLVGLRGHARPAGQAAVAAGPHVEAQLDRRVPAAAHEQVQPGGVVRGAHLAHLVRPLADLLRLRPAPLPVRAVDRDGRPLARLGGDEAELLLVGERVLPQRPALLGPLHVRRAVPIPVGTPNSPIITAWEP